MSEEFDFVQTLGEGAFGKVYLVNAKRGGGQYAMKVIDLRTSPQEEKDLAVAEAQLLKKLDHPHILSYTDSFEKDGALCIVTGYCANGDLSDFLEKRNRKKLEEDRLLEWFRQIASALQYLHGKTIIHRDVKTPNIFLTDDWQTKLGDLGLAKVLERPNAKAVTFCGSPYYMSPEIFSCKPYDEKSDIWALAVIVYEMSTLERPFDAMLMHQLVFKIVHGGLPPMPKDYDPALTQVLSSMMQKDPAKRPTADDLVNNDLFKRAKKPPVIAPKPVPRKPLKPARGVARGGAAGGGDGPFNMRNLLDTLSALHKKDEASAGSDFDGDKTLTCIMADAHKPKMDKTIKNMKTIKSPVKVSPVKPSPVKPTPAKPNPAKQNPVTPSPDRTVPNVTISDVNLSVGSASGGSDKFTATMINFQKKVADESFNVMQLVVRTMTGLFPKDEQEKKEAFSRTTDPVAMMLRQIEHLQYYCIKALNNDQILFQKAYDTLARERDEEKLEENLIQILGQEKFGLCGVQLLFLKNFEYNLEKLQGQ